MPAQDPIVGAPKTPVTYVFSNIRYPAQQIAIVEEVDGVRQRTGHYIEFMATKASTTDPAVAQALRDFNKPYIYEEPLEFTTLDPESEKFYTHRATGFKTLRKDAYEDWVDNSEWSARPR